MHRGAALSAAVLILVMAAVAGCTGAVVTLSHLTSRHVQAGRSCQARPDWATITLDDTSPQPVTTVRIGSRVVVIVPSWGWGKPTRVDVAKGGILREECSVLIPGRSSRSRRTIFLAIGSGTTYLGATVEPASNLFMPAWGGRVTVQSAAG